MQLNSPCLFKSNLYGRNTNATEEITFPPLLKYYSQTVLLKLVFGGHNLHSWFNIFKRLYVRCAGSVVFCLGNTDTCSNRKQ